jgi:acyl carrier protein
MAIPAATLSKSDAKNRPENAMREAEIINVCLSLIGETTGRDIVSEPNIADASVFELGIDSLNIINLIFRLEETLQIDIPLTELDESIFQSIRHLAIHLGALEIKVAA